MRILFAISLVTMYGLATRLAFGFVDDLFEIMGIAFLFLFPFIIGALTIILIPAGKIKTYAGAFFMPWLSSLALLIVTMLLNVEGAICWIMIFPFFAVASGLGGIIAYAIKKSVTEKKQGQANKLPILNISLMMMAPFLVGVVEGDKTLQHKDFVIRREIVINASTQEVWKQLTHLNKIDSSEISLSSSGLFSFPKHIATTIDSLKPGGKRIATYQKGLVFEETITNIKPEELLVLDLNIDPNKIPSNVMDEHIVIGGKYLDILQDDYKLEKLANGKTRLSLSTHFYINTPFNWYSGIWADYIINDILDSELKIVKKRSEL